jgi:isopentenyl diphosphate isomerase/L-lactate dehydrogenase-like FMN-dependent dehydrogenase
MNLEELAALARHGMTKQAYDYYASGAETETSVADNRAAFEDYRIVPRILVDVSRVDTSSTLYGEGCGSTPAAARASECMLRCHQHKFCPCPAGYRMSMPVMVAPMAMHGLAHADKEVRRAALPALHRTLQACNTTPFANLYCVGCVRRWAPPEVQQQQACRW